MCAGRPFPSPGRSHLITRPSASTYLSTFSKIHTLPESSVSGNARRLAVTDISEAWLAGVAIRAELSKAVTRNGSPTGLPDAGAKWIPHTLKNPPRFTYPEVIHLAGNALP